MSNLVFLDLETTGLDKFKHSAWEAAWAVNDGDIQQGFLIHDLTNADPYALEIGRYHERAPKDASEISTEVETSLSTALTGATIVGANPAFDAGFLEQRWGRAVWHHRLIDLETYAMPAFGLDRPIGLNAIAVRLNVVLPDHTATKDVDTLRKCYLILSEYYKSISSLVLPV